MNTHHEHEHEPVRGLPGALPAGEQIVWQGRPDAGALARRLLWVRPVGLYFVALAAWGLVDGSPRLGVMITLLMGAAVTALLHGIAWWSARTTVYTLTSRRLVLRSGMAVTTHLNLPLAAIARADIAPGPGGTADIALALTDKSPLGWPALWPHVRPWSWNRPVPVLRTVPDGAAVGVMIARALIGANPGGAVAARAVPDLPVPAHALAA